MEEASWADAKVEAASLLGPTAWDDLLEMHRYVADQALRLGERWRAWLLAVTVRAHRRAYGTTSRVAKSKQHRGDRPVAVQHNLERLVAQKRADYEHGHSSVAYWSSIAAMLHKLNHVNTARVECRALA